MVKEMARKHTEQAIVVLATVMNDETAKPGERVAAANALLDRGYGKPAQAIVGEEDAPPIVTNLRVELIKPVVDPAS